jgi:hypothetical protein
MRATYLAHLILLHLLIPHRSKQPEQLCSARDFGICCKWHDGSLPVVVPFTDVSEVSTASLNALMMEAASTTETSVNFYQTTRRYNPEDNHRCTHRLENLKSYLFKQVFLYVHFNCFMLESPGYQLWQTDRRTDRHTHTHARTHMHEDRIWRTGHGCTTCDGNIIDCSHLSVSTGVDPHISKRLVASRAIRRRSV